MRLLTFFDDIYLPTRLIGRSPHTVRLYRASISKFSRYLGHEAEIADLDNDVVPKYLASLQESLSIHSVAKEQAQLFALWRLASRRKLTGSWPDMPKIRCPEREPTAWLFPELELILAACAKQQGQIGDNPASVWWTSLILCIWDTGERIGAITNCPWHCYERPWLKFMAESRKGSTRDRRHKLAPDTCAEIDRMKRGKLIWQWPWSRTYLWPRYRRILDQAGLPTDRRSMFHRMRRTTASHLAAAGGDPQTLLDHSHRRTTEKYLDSRIVERVHASEMLRRPKIG